jgi:hypothetical protein
MTGSNQVDSDDRKVIPTAIPGGGSQCNVILCYELELNCIFERMSIIGESGNEKGWDSEFNYLCTAYIKTSWHDVVDACRMP